MDDQEIKILRALLGKTTLDGAVHEFLDESGSLLEQALELVVDEPIGVVGSRHLYVRLKTDGQTPAVATGSNFFQHGAPPELLYERIPFTDHQLWHVILGRRIDGVELICGRASPTDIYGLVLSFGDTHMCCAANEHGFCEVSPEIPPEVAPEPVNRIPVEKFGRV